MSGGRLDPAHGVPGPGWLPLPDEIGDRGHMCKLVYAVLCALGEARFGAVAESAGIGRTTARNKLHDLEELGFVERRPALDHGGTYWRPHWADPAVSGEDLIDCEA